MARGVYEDRAFDWLPILGDALEEAGCDDADILLHCRGRCRTASGAGWSNSCWARRPLQGLCSGEGRQPGGGRRAARPRGDDGLRYECAFEDACALLDGAAREWAEGDPENPSTGQVLRDVLAVFRAAKCLRLPFGAGPT